MKPKRRAGSPPTQEQGVASGMASTTLSVGNAIGLAALIAIANAHAASLKNLPHPAAIADGIRPAFWLAAAGILFSVLIGLSLPSKVNESDV